MPSNVLCMCMCACTHKPHTPSFRIQNQILNTVLFKKKKKARQKKIYEPIIYSKDIFYKQKIDIGLTMKEENE